MALFKYIASVIILLSLSGCDAPTTHEILRITSPDKVVDAVVVVENTDATVASPTQFFIVPAGSKIAGEIPILLGDHIENLEISWASPKKLVVSFSSGRIFSFSNFWEKREVQDFQYKVRIYLKDASSP